MALNSTKIAIQAYTPIEPQLSNLIIHIGNRAKSIQTHGLANNRTKSYFPAADSWKLIVWACLRELDAFIHRHAAKHFGPGIPDGLRLQIPSDVASLIGGLVPKEPSEGKPGLYVNPQMLTNVFASQLVTSMLGRYANAAFDHQKTIGDYFSMYTALENNNHIFSTVHDECESLLGTGILDLNGQSAVVCSGTLAPHSIPLAVTLRLYRCTKKNQSWIQPRITTGNNALMTHLTQQVFYNPLDPRVVKQAIDMAMQPRVANARINART
jgi:hypothetical protein